MPMRTRQLTLASAAILLTLIVSFLGVRWLLSDPEQRLQPLDPKEIRHATQLREFESELVLLLEDFLVHLPAKEGVEELTFEDWTKHSFRPRVSDLQQRLFSANLPRKPYTSLLFAADKVSAIASAPLNVSLRSTGAAATSEAVEDVEQFIAELDLGIPLSPDTPTFSTKMRQTIKENFR